MSIIIAGFVYPFGYKSRPLLGNSPSIPSSSDKSFKWDMNPLPSKSSHTYPNDIPTIYQPYINHIFTNACPYFLGHIPSLDTPPCGSDQLRWQHALSLWASFPIRRVVADVISYSAMEISVEFYLRGQLLSENVSRATVHHPNLPQGGINHQHMGGLLLLYSH